MALSEFNTPAQHEILKLIEDALGGFEARYLTGDMLWCKLERAVPSSATIAISSELAGVYYKIAVLGDKQLSPGDLIASDMLKFRVLRVVKEGPESVEVIAQCIKSH